MKLGEVPCVQIQEREVPLKLSERLVEGSQWALSNLIKGICFPQKKDKRIIYRLYSSCWLVRGFDWFQIFSNKPQNSKLKSSCCSLKKSYHENQLIMLSLKLISLLQNDLLLSFKSVHFPECLISFIDVHHPFDLKRNQINKSKAVYLLDVELRFMMIIVKYSWFQYLKLVKFLNVFKWIPLDVWAVRGFKVDFFYEVFEFDSCFWRHKLVFN